MKLKKLLIFSLILFFLMVNIASSTEESKKSSTSISNLTVIEPTQSGGMHIIQIDEETDKLSRKKTQKIEVTQHTSNSQRKARIVVVPTTYVKGVRSKFKRELYDKLNITDPSVIEIPIFTNHIVNALVNSRKFDVLERESLNAVIKELDFGESDYADLSKTAQIGRMLNADYVVIPKIRYILLIKSTKDVPYVPKVNIKYEATIGTNIRVVDVRTSRLASSDIDDSTYIEKLERKTNKQIRQAARYIDSFFEYTATKEVSKIIDVVYPIKIISVDGGNVTINRGKGAIEPGEILEVYATGKALIDPDTNEYLGYSESFIGKIQVINVKPKFAIANILEGKIKKYYICRRNRETESLRKINITPVPRID